MLPCRIVTHRRAVVVLLLGLAGAPGAIACRTAADSAGAIAVAPGHAICPVCRANGDLACLDVAIRADTPRTSHAGSTYYFCSRECQEEFERKPEAYLPR